MKTKYIILIIIGIVTVFSLKAQQDAQYAQYMYNTMVYNPGYTGSRGTLNIESLYRTQWVGLDGAPDTATLAVSSPVGKSEKVALGLSIIHDRIGPSKETYFDASFSYAINTSDTGKLAFGVKGGFHLFNVDFSELTAFDLDDQLLQTNIENKFSPNVGIGMYYYTPDYYVGLSAPNLIQTNHFDRNANSNNSTAYVAKEKIHYYLLGGYVFNLNYAFKLKPAFIAKVVEGSPLQVDISATALIHEKFSIGVAYRWSAALSALAGFQINEGVFVGYAYDAETTKLSQFNSGSHEIFLRFELFSKNKMMLSPRFF